MIIIRQAASVSLNRIPRTIAIHIAPRPPLPRFPPERLSPGLPGMGPFLRASPLFLKSFLLDFTFPASYDSKKTAAGRLSFFYHQAGCEVGLGMKRSACLSTFVFALMATGICFAADKVSCPGTVTVDEKVTSPPPEWRLSYSPLPRRLEMVTFFNGPPAEDASLVYDKRSKTKGGWIGTWQFPKDEKGYWIRCSYEGTRAELSRRIPDSVSICRVTYDDGSLFASGLPVVRKIECR